MAKSVTVRDLVENLKLEVVSGQEYLDKIIKEKMLSRPGLELAGLFDFYESDRVQIIGSKEVTFYHWLNENDQNIRGEMLFREDTPAFVFSNNFDIPKVFIENSKKHRIPILRSYKNTSALFSEILQYLEEVLAPTISMHGVLLDVHGIGVLIRGKSGIGKSESAMELVKRGHKLVADDNVEIYEKEAGILIGKPPVLLEKVMEIRGIGIVNVVQMFGAGSYRHKKRITLVIDLENMNITSDYDRLGIQNETIKIFNTEITRKKLPIRPGRNIASLIEVACINHRLRYMGYNSAKDFTDKLERIIEEKNKK